MVVFCFSEPYSIKNCIITLWKNKLACWTSQLFISGLGYSSNKTMVIKICNFLMEQHALKNVNNCLNTNILSYLETSGGKSSNIYLNVVYFFNTSVN
jgi:hypothetical protein